MEDGVPSVSFVIDFLEKFSKNELSVTDEERKNVISACSTILACENQNYKKKIMKKSRQDNKKEDKAVIQEARLKRRSNVSRAPRVTEEMFRLSMTPSLDQGIIDVNRNESEMTKERDVVVLSDQQKSDQQKLLHCARMCYCCKRNYNTIHHFYPDMCNDCGDFNYKMRSLSSDLTGKTALITGARVKIGFECALKLLRCGARVIVVTRFPNDAKKRYSLQEDYELWKDRVDFRGVDLRYTPSVERLCESILKDYKTLDILINNACQTIQRPTAYYDHLLKHEDFSHSEPHTSLEVSEVDKKFFPTGLFDKDGQQIDLRPINSWNLDLADVSTVELYEVMLVNAIAPFVINARLKPIMVNLKERSSHIVNVSAMEGQFYRNFKTTKHPHTNMAKAALNMMTRTSAHDYAKSGINMNSIDTGWVTDEHPLGKRSNFDPPLDCIDGAARILHPIFEGYQTGIHVNGKFLKDYKEVMW